MIRALCVASMVGIFGATAAADGPSGGTAGVTDVANVVARVDDKTILLQDVIGPIKPMLEKMRKELPPDEYRRQEREALKSKAEDLIERMVLIKEVEDRFKKDPSRIKSIRVEIDKEFNKNMAKMAKEAGLSGRDDIEKALKNEGTNIQQFRRDFNDRTLANEFLMQDLKSKIGEPSREEMLAYYNEHPELFRLTGGAVWRQIEIRIADNPKDAAEKAYRAQQRLMAGEDFAKVAKEMSDGPTASNGGLWPQTSRGSFADSAVDNAIFSIPVGRFSTPLRGTDSFHIVKVESRNETGVKPFSEVQKEIGGKLKEKRFLTLRKMRIQEYRAKHYIESVFDSQEVAERPNAARSSAR